jgi:drug/metabolite transporter (DMT)-like permease
MDKKPLLYVMFSATLFGLSSPLAKILVKDISPIALAGLLYLGAFIGLASYYIIRKILSIDTNRTLPLGKRDIPWLVGAIASGGIVAPICLMFGLQVTSGFSASLFLNLEGIATAVIAIFFFHENAGKRLWLALLCMTIAGILLAWNTEQNHFNIVGPLLITMACLGWGIDNNLTRRISEKDPIQIVMLKGVIAGTISLSMAFLLGERISFNGQLLFALLLGAFSYGISLVFFVKALKGLGSSRTGVFYSFGPFIGALASIIILKEWLGWLMFPAIVLMMVGVWLIIYERHSHEHYHQVVEHNHLHRHDDLHHNHTHTEKVPDTHAHVHTHAEISHEHAHWPDTDHQHTH